LFAAQRKLFFDLGLNLWAVDQKMPRQLGSHDLVAEFVEPGSLVPGLVSVELKVGGAAGFEGKVARWKEETLARFQKLLEAPSPFQGLLLVSCRARKGAGGGRNSWEPAVLRAELWYQDKWVELSPSAGRCSAQKRAKPKKKTFETVWGSLDKYNREEGPQVVLASHYLMAMGLKNHNVGERAALWNSMLVEDGFGLLLEKMRFKKGSPSWVGTKTIFRRLHRYL
jgi:hypothetical protein